MKKPILLAILMAFTLALPAYASINQDLSYGVKNDDVIELQDFLTDGGFFNGPISGNYFSLTRTAVMKWQKSIGLPSSGYFGKLSRAEFNAIADTAASSTDEEQDNTVYNDVHASTTQELLSEQNTLLQEQIERQRIAQVQADIQARLNALPVASNPVSPTTTVVYVQSPAPVVSNVTKTIVLKELDKKPIYKIGDSATFALYATYEENGVPMTSNMSTDVATVNNQSQNTQDAKTFYLVFDASQLGPHTVNITANGVTVQEYFEVYNAN